MPELPEVETIVRALQNGGRDGPAIADRIVTEARLLWERTLAEPSPVEFTDRLPGQQILEISRRGKYIQIQLTEDTLLIHLRMSGDLRVVGTGSALADDRHDRVVIDFSGGKRLVFHDPRKFGRIWLVNDAQTVLSGLGPEPLDETLTAAEFYNRLAARKRRLKPLLLDQGFLAGMGNIYTDEALHHAGLHPAQSSGSLTPQQAERLLGAIRKVLQAGIRANGASIDWVYRGGGFQNDFRVYRRTRQPCLSCGTPIERLILGQRGTHFCPVCQPLLPSGQAPE